MRGGRRKHSGRRPIPEETRRVPTSLLLSPEARSNLEKLSDLEDESFGSILDKLLTDSHIKLYLTGNSKSYINGKSV